MRDEDKPLLRDLALFAQMEETNFDTMLKGAFFQRFPREVVLIEEGEPADFLHIVVSGVVELFATNNDRQCTMAVVRPVSTFILAAVLKDAPYLMSARTVEPSRILMIPSDNLRSAMEADLGLARAMVGELSVCYRSVVKALKNQKLRTGVERLANFLLRLNDSQGGTGTFKLPLEKRMLASILGMTPENLSRAFATLKLYGVKVKGAEVQLTMIDDLRVLAKPNTLIDDPAS
ncbi:MAG: cyclic nucleotide-binding domain-containing protein [Alphaproteobacteria bacterium]